MVDKVLRTVIHSLHPPQLSNLSKPRRTQFFTQVFLHLSSTERQVLVFPHRPREGGREERGREGEEREEKGIERGREGEERGRQGLSPRSDNDAGVANTIQSA